MHRRGPNRTIDSDPATQGALSVPKIFEEIGDPGGMHREDELDQLLDGEELRDEDEVTARPHELRPHERSVDPRSPEELAGDIILRATQGGGSMLDDEEEDALEDGIDRDAMAAGIVPQLVGQSTLDAASTDEERAPEAEEEAPRRRKTRSAKRPSTTPRAHR